MTPASIRDVLDINLYGTVLGCRAALRAWAREPVQDRCIVNVSSLLAVQGGYGASAYAASKAGVVALTRSLVDEGKTRQIRANVILPGYIESDMTASEFIPIKVFIQVSIFFLSHLVSLLLPKKSQFCLVPSRGWYIL